MMYHCCMNKKAQLLMVTSCNSHLSAFRMRCSCITISSKLKRVKHYAEIGTISCTLAAMMSDAMAIT